MWDCSENISWEIQISSDIPSVAGMVLYYPSCHESSTQFGTGIS